MCHLLDIDEVSGAAALPQISSDLVEDDQVPGKKNHVCGYYKCNQMRDELGSQYFTNTVQCSAVQCI